MNNGATELIGYKVQNNYYNTIETSEELSNYWLVGNVTSFNGFGEPINVYSDLDKSTCPNLGESGDIKPFKVEWATMYGKEKPDVACYYKLEDFHTKSDVDTWIANYGKDTYYNEYLASTFEGNLTSFKPIDWVKNSIFKPIGDWFKNLWNNMQWIFYVIIIIVVVGIAFWVYKKFK